MWKNKITAIIVLLLCVGMLSGCVSEECEREAIEFCNEYSPNSTEVTIWHNCNKIECWKIIKEKDLLNKN